jgi:serine phosphatase RsbU (regulator of sigma subunit)
MGLMIYILFFLQINYLYPAEFQKASDLGRPLIHNYSKAESWPIPQVLCITQDPRGIIYCGNHSLVLEYDGVEWRQLPISKSVPVFSIDCADSGIIYLGAANEMGYFEPTIDGSLLYRSLSEKVNPREADFGEIWNTFCSTEGTHFYSFKHLFRWHNQNLKSWPLKAIGFSHWLDGKIHFYFEPDGYFWLNQDRIEPIPNGEKFRLGSMIFQPINDHYFLASTAIAKKDKPGERNLYLCGRQTYQIYDQQPLPPELSKIGKENSFYGSIGLRQGGAILNSQSLGAICIDSQLNIVQIINEEKGLPNSRIWSSYQDSQGGLWLGTGNGVSRVLVESPITLFGKEEGIDQWVLKLKEFHKTLYAGLESGVGYIDKGHFKKIPGIDLQCWSIAVLQSPEKKYPAEHLVFGSINGLLEIKDNQLQEKSELFKSDKHFNQKTIRNFKNVTNIHAYRKDPRQVLFTDRNGITRFIWEMGKLSQRTQLQGLNNFLGSLYEDENGNFWATDFFNSQLLQINYQGDVLHVTQCGISHGLPSGNATPFLIKNHYRFQTSQGFYRLSGAGLNFEPDYELNQQFQIGKRFDQVRILAEYGSGGYWVVLLTGNTMQLALALPEKTGGFFFQTSPFESLTNVDSFIVYPGKDGVYWIGSSEQLIRFDSQRQKNYQESFFTLIRRVVVQDQDILFAGCFSRPSEMGLIPIIDQPIDAVPILPASQNSLTFQYSAAFYDFPKRTRFRFYLEGYDTHWSEWTEQTRKEYTNLPAGFYHFRVIGRNVYQVSGREACYTFRILSPWYQTWWAYLGYFLTLILFFYSGIHLNSRRLIAAKQKLEQIVSERTAELLLKNKEIEEYASDLSSSNQQLIEAKNELWGEMELAKKIQTVLLPEKPHIPGYEIAAYMKPADEVGGDYYDVIEIKGEWLVDGGQWLDDPGRAEEKDKDPCRGGSCARPNDSGQSPKTNPENPPNLLSGQPQGFAPTGLLSTNHQPLTTASQPSYWLSIGDVSGHGVPAGLVMMMVQTSIRSVLKAFPVAPPAMILTMVNSVIHENIKKLGEDKYMTITLMSVQPDGSIFYSGLHQDIMIYRSREKKVETIETRGMWLGISAEINEQLNIDRLILFPDDIMLLYTDGIIEAVDKDGAMFSDAKLQELLLQAGHFPLAEIKDSLVNALQTFTIHDDITFLIIKKNS